MKEEKTFSRIWFVENHKPCICESIKLKEVRCCIYINDNQNIGYNNCHKQNPAECQFLKYETIPQPIKIWNNP